MPIVAMPDGAQVQFPDNMPAEQIRNLIAAKHPDAIPQIPNNATTDPQLQGAINQLTPTDQTMKPEAPTNVIEKVVADSEKRAAQVDAAKNKDQSAVSSALQQAGAVAGMVGDTGGDVAGSAYRAIPGNETLTDAAKSGVNYLANTDAGKTIAGAAGVMANKASELAKSYPITAANLSAVGNIATIIPAFKGAGAVAEEAGKVIAPVTDAIGTGMSSVGQDIMKAGADRIAADQTKFAQDLITPKQTPGVKKDLFLNSTEQGFSNKQVYKPSAQEQGIIDTVSQLPVSKSNSLLKNFNIISEANNAEAEALKTHLATNDVAIPADTILTNLIKVKDDLAKNTYIQGDAKNAVNNVIDKALNQIAGKPSTASGLLQARKDFDFEIQNEKGPKFFNPNLEGPVTNAVSKIRQAMNQTIADAVPDVAVKASLAKQSNLYQAMDNIATKAGTQATNRYSRIAQRIGNGIPGSTFAKKAAVVAGTAGVGAGAAFAPAIAGAAIPPVLAYKAATNPNVWKAVGAILNSSGKAIASPEANQLLQAAKAKGITKEQLQAAFDAKKLSQSKK